MQFGNPFFPPPPPPKKKEPPPEIPGLPDFLEKKREEAQFGIVEKAIFGILGVGAVELGYLGGIKGKATKFLGKKALEGVVGLSIGSNILNPGNLGPSGHLNLPPGIYTHVPNLEEQLIEDARRKALVALENSRPGFLRPLGALGLTQIGPSGPHSVPLTALTNEQIEAAILAAMNHNLTIPANGELLQKLLREQARRRARFDLIVGAGDAIARGAGRLFPTWEVDP